MTRRAPIRRKAGANGHSHNPTGKLVVPSIVGVDASEWTDLPPAAYPMAVVERVIVPRLDAGEDLVRLNGYLCQTCQGITLTYDLHPGIAPAFVDHAAFDPDTRCPGMTASLNYPRELIGEASHEFYRPSEDELVATNNPDVWRHVLSGALLLRPIPAGTFRGRR